MAQERTVHTKKKIIDSAKKAFLKSGFDGASVSQISKGAGVPNSLIFHHFESKANLWKEVKQNIKDKIAIENSSLHTTNLKPGMSLKTVLKRMIEEPLKVLINHPELARLYKWEILEDEPMALWTYKVFSQNTLQPIFKALREHGELNPTLSDDFLSYFLFSQTAAALVHEFQPNIDIDGYIEQLTKQIEMMLSP